MTIDHASDALRHEHDEKLHVEAEQGPLVEVIFECLVMDHGHQDAPDDALQMLPIPPSTTIRSSVTISMMVKLL